MKEGEAKADEMRNGHRTEEMRRLTETGSHSSYQEVLDDLTGVQAAHF